MISFGIRVGRLSGTLLILYSHPALKRWANLGRPSGVVDLSARTRTIPKMRSQIERSLLATMPPRPARRLHLDDAQGQTLDGEFMSALYGTEPILDAEETFEGFD